MQQLVIDRFEGKFAICENADQRYFAIETQELPEGAKEGSVLEISGEGELSLYQEETERRRQAAALKQKKAFDR